VVVLRHAPVCDCSTDCGAYIGALEYVPKDRNERGAKNDQECTIAREIAKAEIYVPLQPTRQRHRFRDRPVEISGGGNRHECQANSEQDLFEIGGLIQAAIKPTLEYDAKRADH